jgi:hypothetical protein
LFGEGVFLVSLVGASPFKGIDHICSSLIVQQGHYNFI